MILLILFSCFLSFLSSPAFGKNSKRYTFEDMKFLEKHIAEFYSDMYDGPHTFSPCHRALYNIQYAPDDRDTLDLITASTADCSDRYGNTPLLFALLSDNYALIKRILSFNPDLKRLVGPFRRPYISYLKPSINFSISSSTDEQLEEIPKILLKDNCDAIHVRLTEDISFRDELLFKPWTAVSILKTIDAVCPRSIDYRDLVDPYKILYDFIDSNEYSPRFVTMCTSSISLLKNNYGDGIIRHALSKITM